MDSNQFLFNKQFSGVIWGTIISEDGRDMILDTRNLESKTISYFKLSLVSFELEELKVENANWWSNLEAYDGDMFISEYQDKNDPNEKNFFRWRGEVCDEVKYSIIPQGDNVIVNPSIYEPGTEYHQTVSDFLAMEIPCSCEYLEIDEKIILSYYLRSSKQLDRHLLVLDGGAKVLKEVQDEEMLGFAPDAFFVMDNRLFFVKNRNEICIHIL